MSPCPYDCFYTRTSILAEVTQNIISHDRSDKRPTTVLVTISLDDIKRGVFERGVPGQIRAGPDVISCSDLQHKYDDTCLTLYHGFAAVSKIRCFFQKPPGWKYCSGN